jgi:hypothetical protein
MRTYRCWCKACTLVNGRGDDCVSRGKLLDMPSCLRSKLSLEGRAVYCAAGSRYKADTSGPPVSMLINSREFRTTGFNLKEVFPPTLETISRVYARSGPVKS